MNENPCLILFDSHTIPDHMTNYFAKFSYRIIQYNTLEELEPIHHASPIAVIVDIDLLGNQMNPSMDALHHHFKAPLIVISQRYCETAYINALNAGADDVITTPIHPRELHARITAISRRIIASELSPTPIAKEQLVFCGWTILPHARQVFYNGCEVLFSPIELTLLLAFARQPQTVLSRTFLAQISTEKSLTTPRQIDLKISRIRRKMSMGTMSPPLIKTVRNLGYTLSVPVKLVKNHC